MNELPVEPFGWMYAIDCGKTLGEQGNRLSRPAENG